jgi:hypothetical protein
VPPEWTLPPGQTIERKALQAGFGGRTQGGIGPSKKTPNVFLFSDPVAGEPHGYYDGWQADGCFHYTGEGQRGDQQMKSGNASILNHQEEGRALRVFEGARGLVTYVDEFELDAERPYYRTDAPETGDGPIREVFVFRLRPKTIEPGRPSTKLTPVLQGPRIEGVPVEQQHTERAFVSPSRDPYEAERREQRLVLELERFLRRRRHEVSRLRIVPAGESRPLFTDLWDATTGTLIEAKGSVERNAIRLAIGQLADYKRFVDDAELKHLAVLLPREPRPDLCHLLGSEGIERIYPAGGGFNDSAQGALLAAPS